jgi:hypothetical protein
VPAAIARAKVAAKAASAAKKQQGSGNGASSSASGAPLRPPQLSLRERLGDGVWLLVLGAVLVLGVAVLLLDRDAEFDPSPSAADGYACTSLYYWVTTFCAALALLVAMHLLVHVAPRPVSHVDASPVSTTIAAIVVVAPPVLAVWSLSIMVWPARTRQGCSWSEHQALWSYFGSLVALGAGVVLLFVAETVRVLWRTLVVAKQEVSPASGAPTEAGTFTTEQPRLDNAQWLAMEGRRLRESGARR